MFSNNKEAGAKKKDNNLKIIIGVALIAIFAGLIVMMINLFTEKSSYTSSGDTTTSPQSLYCTSKSGNIDGAFFDFSKASSVTQAVKVLFKDKKIDVISYNASAKYPDADIAKIEEANLYAKYGTYVQDNGKSMTVYSPNFSASETGVNISLTANYEKLTRDLAKIFMIDTDDTNLSNYTSKVLSTLYKSKGFKCESKE